MCISARDDSLSWPMHALLYVCSRLKELALLSHSQLVAGIVAHILRSAYIFGKRSSSHSLRALAAVFGLSSFGFEEYLKKIRNIMYCHNLSLTHLSNLLCNFGISQNLISLFNYVPPDLESKKFLT